MRQGKFNFRILGEGEREGEGERRGGRGWGIKEKSERWKETKIIKRRRR